MLKMNSDLALLAPAKPFSAHLPIQFEGVHLSFGKHLIFSNLNLEIGAQGITAIMGPNGAGKSLILRLLAGLLMPGQGSVRFNQSNRIPRDQIGFVFQRPVLLRRSVQDNLLHALADTIPEIGCTSRIQMVNDIVRRRETTRIHLTHRHQRLGTVTEREQGQTRAGNRVALRHQSCHSAHGVLDQV